MEPSQEMIDFFHKRTREHITRVKQNMVLMEGYLGLSLQTLVERANVHDESKFSEQEQLGYIWLSWMHHQKSQNMAFEYPHGGIQDLVTSAIDHHVTHNLHHPEAHTDHNLMSELDLVEMVCDWTAMSQEFNQASCQPYVDRNLDVKWKFSHSRKGFIYQIIQEMDKRNGVNRSHNVFF